MVPTYSVRIPRVPTYSLCPRFVRFRLQDFHLVSSAFPVQFDYQPPLSGHHKNITILTSGSSDFARHYFRNRFYFLFLRVLRCFSSPGSPHYTMHSYNDLALLMQGVPSFGYLRIIEYLLLPAAFRSLSRPSSAPCTKASSVSSL